jgi:hypothetical protein
VLENKHIIFNLYHSNSVFCECIFIFVVNITCHMYVFLSSLSAVGLCGQHRGARFSQPTRLRQGYGEASALNEPDAEANKPKKPLILSSLIP